MKRDKQYIAIITILAMLLAVSCQRDETIDDDKNSTGELRFSPTLGLAQTADTRAAESDNKVLQSASVAGATSPHIAIKTYTGTPGKSLEPYFSDELGYFGASSNWDVNSGTKRFLPEGGMNLYAYYATNAIGKGDLTNVIYTAPATTADHPNLTFTVATNDALNQVDLIAAKVEGIKNPNIQIPLRHILSQINFGVKGLEQHQITVKNIRINNVNGAGTFDYNTWKWNATTTANYPYYFPDRKTGSGGSGENYKTQGIIGDSQNSYCFGDGGKFGPGDDATFLYAQANSATYATKENTITPLHNSLMLMPQGIMKNADATVTFDYEITNQGTVVHSGTNSTVRLDAYYDWKPNMRYVYLFKFDDPAKITFDVLVEPWIESPGNIETNELNSVTLFEKHVRVMKAGDSYEVPLGALSSDFICDWSLYSLDNSFTTVNQTFSLSFESPLSFADGKSVVIKPPFGFKASTSKLTAPGTVTFTPIYPFYTTSAALNAAITNSGDYVFSVTDAIKLSDISFTGSTNAEYSLTLRYLSPYSGTPPSRWSMYDQNTAVCFPNDYALTTGSVPYSYTVYTAQGLKAVFDWMNGGAGNNPGGSNSTATVAERMQTNINLAQVGRYNLADVYANATNGKDLFVPIGNATNPYSGTFDGKGATVENLYINNSSDCQGFFGYTSGVAQNLHLKNVSVKGQNNVGAVAGVESAGKITACSVSGNVSGNYTVSGIVGNTWNFAVYGCYSTAKITGGDAHGITNQIVNNCFYVASADIGDKGIRLPSIATLNGKIPTLNRQMSYSGHQSHYVSGTLNSTTPNIVAGAPTFGFGGTLSGTFIQNWFALGWDQNRWNAEMALLATVGMEYLVIDQVMELSNFSVPYKYMSWYPASSNVLVNDNLEMSPNPNALEYCMKACRAHGIKLFIGTFFDKRYWDSGAAVANPTQWNNCITTSNNIMTELTKFYFNGASSTMGDYTDLLAGWYFPYEVDDFYFKTGEAQTLLKNGIKSAMTCRDGLGNAEARKPYLFSPFMNGNGREAFQGTMTSTEYAALWKDIITNAGFKSGDILSPQDCIGVEKLTIADLQDWMPKLQDATTATTGVEFWINVETFGPGGNASLLTGQQIPASKPYAAKLISFSYPIYYSPNSDRKQGDHDAYKAYYDAQ